MHVFKRISERPRPIADAGVVFATVLPRAPSHNPAAEHQWCGSLYPGYAANPLIPCPLVALHRAAKKASWKKAWNAHCATRQLVTGGSGVNAFLGWHAHCPSILQDHLGGGHPPPAPPPQSGALGLPPTSPRPLHKGPPT